LIDQGKEAGILQDAQEDMNTILGDMRDILKDIRDHFLGIKDEGVDAFGAVGDAAEDAGRRAIDAFDAYLQWLNENGFNIEDPNAPSFDDWVEDPASGGGMGGEYLRRLAPAGSSFIGGAGGLAQQVAQIVGDISLPGSTDERPINIELRLGRRVLRQVIKETLNRGTQDGDLTINQEAVYEFT
jgi:hypothetical protein